MWGPGNQEECQLKIARAESQSWKGSEKEVVYLNSLPVQGSEPLAAGSESWQRKQGLSTTGTPELLLK